MKTTVELPEQLLRKAKVLAAERGITFREILVHSLEMALSTTAVDLPPRRENRPLQMTPPDHAWKVPAAPPLKRQIALDPATLLAADREDHGASLLH